MKVKNHLLYEDKQVEFKKSPNVGGNLTPKYLVIHFTASSTASGAINWMVDPKSKVSAHLHIARDGKVVQLVPFNVKAWHAGVSEWLGLKGLNSYSIGIELQNTGKEPYTDIQLKVTTEVAKALHETYKFDDILGHSDIAPGRKTDPGPMFPMAKFKQDVLGKTATKQTTADLNLREGKGTQFKAITVLPKGTSVEVIEDSDTWVKIQVPTNKLTGYVNKSYLK